jgi:hypothetical protein
MTPILYFTTGCWMRTEVWDGSFLWSIVKIATGHVHDSKQTRVKTAHVHPATCNLGHCLTRHGSPIIYRCFAVPQLVYRWRHQCERFWILPRTTTAADTYRAGSVYLEKQCQRPCWLCYF